MNARSRLLFLLREKRCLISSTISLVFTCQIGTYVLPVALSSTFGQVLEPLALNPVSLHDESGQKQDIADYVMSFVHSDRRMKRWRDEDKGLVISTLPEKADGM